MKTSRPKKEPSWWEKKSLHEFVYGKLWTMFHDLSILARAPPPRGGRPCYTNSNKPSQLTTWSRPLDEHQGPSPHISTWSRLANSNKPSHQLTTWSRPLDKHQGPSPHISTWSRLLASCVKWPVNLVSHPEFGVETFSILWIILFFQPCPQCKWLPCVFDNADVSSSVTCDGKAK